MSTAPKYFEQDIAFSASENPFGFKTLRLFGEKLLHIEMNTDYGKKEIVFGHSAIHNVVMLKNKELERCSVFASYEVLENGNVSAKLLREGVESIWLFDFENGRADVELFGTKCQIMISPLMGVE